MVQTDRTPSYSWIVALGLTLAVLAIFNLKRISRIEWLSDQVAIAPVVDASSPTGYAGGVRRLVAPGHNNKSYQWIAQSQRMIATKEWRLRRVDYDNAPIGRAVYTSSLYRWWLGALGSCAQFWSGQPIGLAVERMALLADPLLLVLLLIIGARLIASCFGTWPAIVFTVSACCLYPFGGAFLPGCPDHTALSLVLTTLGGLCLLAGVRPETNIRRSARFWLVLSGFQGGIGLWLHVGTAVVILLAFGLGALLGELMNRRTPLKVSWRVWSLAGAGTSLTAWLLEYAPDHLSLAPTRLSENHLLYAAAWWGGGELLVFVAARLRGEKPTTIFTRLVLPLFGSIAFLALPTILFITKSPGFLTADAFAQRLTALDGVESTNMMTWLREVRGGLRPGVLFLSVCVLIPAIWLLVRQRTNAAQRLSLALGIVPSFVTLSWGCFHLSWWNQFGGCLLVLVTALVGPRCLQEAEKRQRAWLGVIALALLVPGLPLLSPAKQPNTHASLSAADKISLAERDFSHWLSLRAETTGVIVLAPPDLTVSLYYHGSLRGLGSPYRENEDGLVASIRIAGSSTAGEAHALIKQRQVAYIAIPPWDDFLTQYARLGASNPDHALIQLLHNWLPPRWLKPVPYYLPVAPELGDIPLILFETTEIQDEATALSRLTEYFVDLGNHRLALLAAKALASDFNSDVSAMVAKARTELMRRDMAGFTESLSAINLAIQEGGDENLPFDRRVSLALVLIEANQIANCRTQLELCLVGLGRPEIRSLSESTLFRFLTLCRTLNLQIPSDIKSYAKTLLPTSMQDKL